MSSDTTNIYVSDAKKRDYVSSDASEAEKYIIRQNELLEKEKQRLEKRIKDCEKKNRELESENEKMEQQKTYMGGIIKNCVEVDKLREKIAVNLDSNSRTQTKFLKEYKHKMTKHTRILQTVMSMVVMFSLQFSQSPMDFILILLSMLCIASFQESLILNLVPPEADTSKLDKLLKEVENMSVAQKHLENYIAEL